MNTMRLRAFVALFCGVVGPQLIVIGTPNPTHDLVLSLCATSRALLTAIAFIIVVFGVSRLENELARAKALNKL
jgi:threonine/homoserine/homoserine lactone efflux protein